MKKIKYDCVENENYITFVMDGETLEEIEIGTHGAPSQGRTIIGAKDLKNALEFIDCQVVAKSATSEEVAEAIEQLKYAREQDREFDDGTFVDSLDLAITALQAYQPWIPVRERLPESGIHVLLCCEVRPSGKRYVCDGYYAKPKSIIGGDDGECSTEYDEETDEYYLLEGYYEVIKNWDDYSSIVIDDFVVAWKPLPEPPKGE